MTNEDCLETPEIGEDRTFVLENGSEIDFQGLASQANSICKPCQSECPDATPRTHATYLFLSSAVTPEGGLLSCRIAGPRKQPKWQYEECCERYSYKCMEWK